MARQRFRKAADSIGAVLTRHQITATGPYQDLTIDVATIEPSARTWTVVITSGLHGIEGFFGSAIQLAWLTQADRHLQPARVRMVLVHAVNPFGFAELRRTNEDNVDLNRNFFDSPVSYNGTPDGYHAVTRYLNPASPPSRCELFQLKALWLIGWFGFQAIKETVAGGQYSYPLGLFFGGHRPTSSTLILQDNLPRWIARSHATLHIDLHSGLGRYARHRLLLKESEPISRIGWYQNVFGRDNVESAASQYRTAYRASGTLVDWTTRHQGKEYRFVNAEFGTYSTLRVLSALRAENRAYFFDQPRTSAYTTAKTELLECFCPSNDHWRTQVVTEGLSIIDRAVRALMK